MKVKRNLILDILWAVSHHGAYLEIHGKVFKAQSPNDLPVYVQVLLKFYNPEIFTALSKSKSINGITNIELEAVAADRWPTIKNDRQQLKALADAVKIRHHRALGEYPRIAYSA